MCRLVGEGGTGVHEGRAYLVMELLGASLAQLRAAAPGHRFELALVQSIGSPVTLRLIKRPRRGTLLSAGAGAEHQIAWLHYCFCLWQAGVSTRSLEN